MGPSTKVIMSKDLKMEWGSLSGLIVLNTRASSLKIRYKDKANIFGQIKDSIGESGLITKCTVTELILGKMGSST